jgi:hypothetical protein
MKSAGPTAAERSESFIRRAASRLRQQGPSWIWKRLSYEIESPSTALGRRMRRGMLQSLVAARALRRKAGSGPAPDPVAASTLYAFYDLKVSPITFDVLWFIVGAEAERRRLGLDAVHFVVVPGPAEGVREEDPVYESVVDAAARRWRITYLLVPCFGLLPHAGWTCIGSRRSAAALRDRAAHVYPAGYEPALPASAGSNDALAAWRSGFPLATLEAPPESRRQVERWLQSHAEGRRCITITLRSYGYMPDRNSNEAAWVAFARRLDPAKYLCVFVLDTHRTLDPTPPALAEFVILREASWNIGLRLALYEAAYLNLSVNNGPMLLCWLGARPRYVTFKMVTPSVPQATEDFIRSRGFEIGRSLPFAAPGQKLVWEDDTLAVIEREFNAMVEHLEAMAGESGGIDRPRR